MNEEEHQDKPENTKKSLRRTLFELCAPVPLRPQF